MSDLRRKRNCKDWLRRRLHDLLESVNDYDEEGALEGCPRGMSKRGAERLSGYRSIRQKIRLLTKGMLHDPTLRSCF